MCGRCRADPKPERFGSPRRCAFAQDGTFTPDNWACATIDALVDRRAYDIEGEDETMTVVPAHHGEHGGWIVLTRYKHRGKVSSAIHVGDFYPPRPVTLRLVESAL
jgi:hypothetical protein